MSELYFENTKTGKRYKVLGLDKLKHEVTLQGPHAKFTEPYDKERFEKLGYRLVKEDPHGAGARSEA
jgi:hypothetical protein